jgi:predicted dehydrogenase
LEASFVSALQQTYTVLGSAGAIELPHDAFVPWERDATYTVRGLDEEEGSQHIVPGADEYQLMVEHFAAAILGKTTLAFPPQESVRNMRVLDGLAEAAQTGRTVILR